MKSRALSCWFAYALTCVAVLSAASAGEVALHVRDYGRVARQGWPVTGGVPFGLGRLRGPEGLELSDAEGVRVPLQSEPLARWPDGSVKWLLVDFPADLDARQTAEYSLRWSDETAAAAPSGDVPFLRWRQTADGVAIDTGVLRAVVGRQFLQQVSVRSASGEWIPLVDRPGEMTVTVDGQRQGSYLASLDPNAEVAVEETGPQRLCVRVTGWHVSPTGSRYAPYVLRVHAFAGKPYLRVFHTFIVSDLPQRGLITGLAIRVPVVPQPGGRASYGGTAATIGENSGGWVAQTGFRQQEIVHDGARLPGDVAGPGCLAVETPGGTVACVVRNFAQLYPKKLEYGGGGLTCWIWPESAGPLDLRREEDRRSPEWLAFKEQYPKAYAEWIDPGTAKSAGISARRYRTAVRQGQMGVVAGASALGLARTHEMWWGFQPGGLDCLQPGKLAAAVEEPLMPFVDPYYLDETEVLGRLGWQDREAFPRVENYIDRKLDWAIRHQNKWARWWGMIDYGGVQSIYETLRDVTIPGQWLRFMGRHGWHNSEVDIPNLVMYPYLRSGDRRTFHFYESLLRHQMDVDTIHANLPELESPDHAWQEGEWTRGGQHRHSYNHWSGAPNIGHTWNEGLVNYYFLTGDRRARDVALEVGEYSLGAPAGKVPSTFDKWTNHPNPKLRFDRSPANAYVNLLKCYELTGEERWKREALRWRRHFLDHSPEYLDQQPATFHVTTYLVRTLAADYHIFREPRVGEELVRVARWHCDHIQSGYDERGLHYPYLACGLAWWIARDDELLLLPWQRYLGECQSETAQAQKRGDFNQSHFYELGQLPFFVRACQEAGLAEDADGSWKRSK